MFTLVSVCGHNHEEQSCLFPQKYYIMRHNDYNDDNESNKNKPCFYHMLDTKLKNTQCVTLVVKIDKINVVYTLNAPCAFDTSLCMKLINQLVVNTQDYKKNQFKGRL